jgi:acetate kinase
VFHYASDVGKLAPGSTSELHISVAEHILNKQGGWKSLTGTTDMGKIIAASDSDPKMKLAFDLFVDRICGFIGSYYVTLEGKVDALVFAGGIGERSEELRRRVVEQCACLGFAIGEGNKGVSDREGAVVDISQEGFKRVLVCRTDEQFEMARGCMDDENLFS